VSGASSFVGRAVPLRLADIDTDMIIPKQYLTWLTKRGIGEGLFREARRLPDGSPDPGFPLNQSAYAEATILVAGDNFGTGSSREHAVWALMDAGFRAVISSRFGEIFRANAVKNGLLPVQVTPFEAAEAGQAFVVDVEGQVLSGGEARVSFALAVVERRRLVDRIDEIAEALASDRLIAAFEGRSPRRVRPAPTPRTLCDKVWDDHVVEARVDGSSLLYIDGHLVHEVSSPLAFEGLRTARRKVRAPGRTLAVVDHNVPTRERHRANANPEGTAQMAALAANAAEHGIEFVGPSRVYHCLRRQPCADPWRARCAGLRHRYFRGRACPCDPDAGTGAATEPADSLPRKAAAGNLGEGPGARRRRRARRLRRERIRD